MQKFVEIKCPGVELWWCQFASNLNYNGKITCKMHSWLSIQNLDDHYLSWKILTWMLFSFRHTFWCPMHLHMDIFSDIPLLQWLNLGKFAMPETCENWPSLVNSCIYYACQTHRIHQVLPYSVELWNPLSKTLLSKCSFQWNKNHVGCSSALSQQRSQVCRFQSQ